MLEWAGWSIAPANAHPNVLARVDEVTASNDEDGVALAIERLLAVLVPQPRPVTKEQAQPGLGVACELPVARRRFEADWIPS